MGEPVVGAAGPVAEDIAEVWWFMLAAGTAVYVLVLALLIVPILRRRSTGERRDEVSPRVANRWIVGGGVVLPVILLSAVLAASVATMREIPQSAPDDGLHLEVVGQQWWWSIHYPDQDITVPNELHIPVDTPVELTLTSTDVIHSFWVPELAGKIDALPDGPNTLVIEADEPGEYRGHCAEFCGLEHAKMGLVVIAEPRAEFEAWVDEQQRPAAEPAGGAEARGEAVFLDQGCARCHTVEGTAGEGADGPDLTHFASRRTFAAATLSRTSEHLTRWLTRPETVKAGTEMAAVDLPDDEVDDLVAYLQGLG